MSAGTAIDATLDRRVGPSPGLRARVRAVPPGRPFLTPTVDALFVCGGFSLPLLFVAGGDAWAVGIGSSPMLWVFVLFNYAHFASSTLRLYSKPGATREHPFLAWGAPLVAGSTVMAATALPDVVGRGLIALYLTWSPFHYARQAYGVTLMYGYRSGMRFSPREKRWLHGICILPFARAVVDLGDTSVGDVMGVGTALALIPAPLLDAGRDEIELQHAILYSLPGSPVLYSGDEIMLGDNVYLGDRDGVRTPMQWSSDRNGGFSRADFAQL